MNGTTGRSPLQQLARGVHRRTDGNPLFMVNMVDHLLSQGVLVRINGQWLVREAGEIAAAVPEMLRQLIEQRLAQVSAAERAVLQAASVAGAEFSAAAAAAGLGTEVEAIEEQCAELARRAHFLRAGGAVEWPDGTVATRYGFLHALYQEVLYDRIPAGQRQRFHQRIAERQEHAYGAQAREIAAELAMHFQHGRDHARAVHYRYLAGDNAVRRSAYQEAIAHITQGLALLETLPQTLDRLQQELPLQTTLGSLLQALKGYGAPEAERPYARARELCQQLGPNLQLFWALRGLSGFYLMRAELQTAKELGEQLLALAENLQDSAFFIEAHHSQLITLTCLGELVLARHHFERVLALYDPQKHNPLTSSALQDPKVTALAFAARLLWMLGYPDQALQRSREALTLAEELSHPFSYAWALDLSAVLHYLRREQAIVEKQVEALMALAAEQGLTDFLVTGALWRAWTLVEKGGNEEGITAIRQARATSLAAGTLLPQPEYLTLLAEACEKMGRIEEGLAVVTEALAIVEKTEARYSEVELYRLKGQLTLKQSGVQRLVSSVQKEAEDCFLKAIEIARRQSAKSLELRAVMSLSRLWHQQGKKEEARQMLAEIYGWFTEGFDTADLQEAKALLEELED